MSTRNEIFNLSTAVHVSKTFVHEPPIFLDPEDVLIISNFSALSDFFYYLFMIAMFIVYNKCMD